MKPHRRVGSPAAADLILIEPMQRASVLAVCLFVGCVANAQAKPAQRILMHTYGSGSGAVVISLIDVLPSGPVRILASSPSTHVRHGLSHAEFGRMWTTLVANGARKLEAASPSKTVDGASNYVFSLAEVPSARGKRFVVPKILIVANKDASPSVVAVARKIRGLLKTR